MRHSDFLSVVLSTRNDAETVREVVERLHTALTNANVVYEIIAVDANSHDDTQFILSDLARHYPMMVIKTGRRRGQTSRYQESIKLLHAPRVCLLAGDLQYPPEAIAPMLMHMQRNQASIAIGRRRVVKLSTWRRLAFSMSTIVVNRFLFGLPFDIQSRLKICDTQIFKRLCLSSTDMELIIRTAMDGYKVVGYDVPFTAQHGEAVSAPVFKDSYKLAKSSVRLKWELMRHGITRRHINTGNV